MSTKNESSPPLLNKFPVELSPPFTTPKANMPVVLVPESEIVLMREGKKYFQGIGHIALEWLPRPAIRFHAKSSRANIDILPDKCQLISNELGRPLVAQITDQQISTETVSVKGFVRDDVLPHGMEISAASFSLPNFKADLGKPVRDAIGRSSRRARSEFKAEGWIITLDEVRDFDEEIELRDELDKSGGYGITHTGYIHRIDKSTFKAKELLSLKDDLFWFFSFCRGFKTGPLLIQLYGKDNTDRFLNLSFPIIEPWQERILWLNELEVGSLASIFKGYLRRVHKPIWTKPIRSAIHWYLAMHAQAGAIQGAIIFGQTALELLGWTGLVDDEKLISSDGYEKLPAADKIRLLLFSCGIPLEIPKSLVNLDKTARAENWKDTAQCIAEIRNALVHPSTKKQGKLDRVTFPAIVDAWRLCLWNLELVLLCLFDYKGNYVNRLGPGQWRGEKIQQVPWAKEEANKGCRLSQKKEDEDMASHDKKMVKS